MPENPTAKLLIVKNLIAGYSGKKVIDDASLEVEAGETVAIIGHNGAGKSTLLRCVFGLVPILGGELRIDGNIIDAPSPRNSLLRGISYIPQGNRIFMGLSVRENLEMGGCNIKDKGIVRHRIGNMCNAFPILRERFEQKAAVLSGGERQILALASALMISPRILLADEPSLGLAPQLIGSVLGSLKRLSTDLGTAVIIVEQRVRAVLKVSDRVYVLRRGRVTFSGASTELADESFLRQVYL